jgi:uncharacterized RDD family membrane protein YckC
VGAQSPVDAGLPRRLGAAVYELLLLTALAFITQFLLLPLVSPGHAGPASALSVPALPQRTFIFCAQFAVFALYCVWFWTRGRRTLAQKTWSLRLATADGAAPDTRQALLRYLATWIGPALALLAWRALAPSGHAGWAAIPLLANFLWALVDRERLFLHDRIAGTRLVVEPR